jgi:hypothetical protein
MTREALLDHVPLAPEQIHRIEGELKPEAAADKYESELRNSFRLEGAQSPRFDLVALGMGRTATPLRCFRTRRRFTRRAAWRPPIMCRRKTPGASRSPGR